MTTSVCLGVHIREVGFTYHRILFPRGFEEEKRKKERSSFQVSISLPKIHLWKRPFFSFQVGGVEGYSRGG